MRNKRRAFGYILALLIVVSGLFVLAACNDGECNHRWTDATCTQPKTCTRCDATEGEALGHQGGYATCSVQAVCDVCGESYGEVGAHAWVGGSCTEAKRCSVCGTSDSKVPGHLYDAWQTVVAANCTEKGSERRDCQNCDHYEEREVDSIGHQYTDEITAPTCKKEGYTTRTCACGDSYVVDRVEALGHEFGEWTYEEGFNCLTGGFMRRDCTREGCKHHQIREVESADHTYGVWVEEIPATCEATGTHGYYQCTVSVCGKKFDENKNELTSLVIPAKGHDCGQWIAEVPATCESDGVRGYYQCSVCEKYLDANKRELTDLTIAAKGHSYSAWIEEVAATCVEGTKAHYHCAACGKNFDARKEVMNSIVIAPVVDHTYGDWIAEVPATCEGEGVKGHFRCSVCGKNFDAQRRELTSLVIAAKGHNYGAWIAEVAPTCEGEGVLAHYHCAACDKNFDADKKELTSLVIAAKGHNYGTWIAEIAATCETDGVLGHYHCVDCGKDFDAEKNVLHSLVIHALGHNYGALIVEVPATCEGEGVLEHFHCSVCEKNFDEQKNVLTSLVIPAKGHNYGDWISEVPATCEGEGELAHYHCDDCGKDFDADKEEMASLVIPANGHNYGAWIDEIPATCDENGVLGHYHCSVCEKNFDANYAVLHSIVIVFSNEHTYGDWIVEIPATCESAGVRGHFHCSICEKDFDANKEELTDLVIPAKGHDYGEWIEEVPATCEGEGTLAHYHCAACDKNFDANKEEMASLVIPATGHDYGDWIAEVPAVCDNDGALAHYHCDDCGKDFDAEKNVLHSLVIHALGHDYGDWIVEVPATCEGEGTKGHFQCSVCEKNFDEQKNVLDSLVIPANGHNYGEWNAEIPADCLNNGTKGYYHCSECDKNFDADYAELTDLVIPALGHTFGEWNEEVPATCEGEGVLGYQHCSACDKNFDAYENELTDLVIPAKGHNYGEWIADVPATCEGEGTLGHLHCSACGKNFNAEKQEMTSLAIPALGHHYTYTSLGNGTHTVACDNGCGATETANCSGGEATCTAQAECEFCEGEYGATPEHQWGDGVVTMPATCTANGTRTFTCGTCGETKSETILSSGRHSYVNDGAVVVTEPTCVANGYTTYNCDNCDESHIADEIPATGHDWDKTAVTCTEGRSCTVQGCGATEDALLGHNHVLENATPATCTEAAVNYYKCSRCDDDYTETVGTANGHDFTTVERADNDDTNDCGFVQWLVCGCGHEEQGETVWRHSYVAAITTPATCTTNGVKTLTCSKCGDSKTETIESNATGHAWNTSGAVENGKRVDTCGNEGCNATRTVTVYEENTTGSTNANDLRDTEIELKDANISLDKDVIDGIGDEDITISAGKLEGDERNELVSEDQLDQIGNSPIYNFTINDGAIYKFEGYVTITLPYTLGDNEDVDSIYIWFITDDPTDEDEDRVTAIKATYNEVNGQGYVTFQTDHFSYYTVTKLTPKQRCDEYGHTGGGTVIATVIGSCLTDGYVEKFCPRCHETWRENEVKAPGQHNYLEVTTGATCTTDGLSTFTCQNDGCNASYTVKIPATGHNYAETERVEATCEAAGYVKYACACGAERIEPITQLTHVVNSEEILPTCDAYGYIRYWCDNCSYSYTAIGDAPLGHNYVLTWVWSEDYREATAQFVCSHDASHAESKNATVRVKETKATCTAKGSIVYTATVTDINDNETLLTDIQTVETDMIVHEDGFRWMSNHNQHWRKCDCGNRINVEDHSFDTVTVTKAPTCTEAGEQVLSCVCGATRRGDSIPATGHTIEEWVITTAPTCTEKGEERGNCAHCSYYEIREVAALGHTYGEWNEEIAATCEEDGVLGYYYCSVCEKNFDKEDKELTDLVVPALGHTYGEWIDEVSATCEGEGAIGHYRCEACGKYFDAEKNEVESVVISALGHTYGEWNEEIPATCVEAGTLGHYFCSVCEKTFDAEKKELISLVIPALGHTYGEWNEEIAATCEEDGVLGYYYCSVCEKNFDKENKELTDLVIHALGHDYGEWIDEVAATCEGEGTLGHYHCAACDKNFDADKNVLESIVIPALGHTYGEWIAEIPATCVEAGTLGHYHCSVCETNFDAEKNVLRTLTIPATREHTYEDGVCTGCGKAETDCDHEMHEVVIDLSQYGCCTDEIRYLSCECGEYTDVDVQGAMSEFLCEFEFNYDGETDTGEVGATWKFDITCSQCGLRAVCEGSRLADLNCRDKICFVFDVYMGDVLIAEDLTGSYYDGLGNCNTQLEEINLSDYGHCGGILSIWRCVDCGDTNFDVDGFEPVCEFEFLETEEWEDEFGNMYMRVKAVCPVCGFGYDIDASYVVEDCWATITYHFTFYIGEDVLEFTSYEYENEHRYEYAEIALSEYGCCDGYIVVNRCAGCGDIRNVQDAKFGCDMEMTESSEDENHRRATMTCKICGLTVVQEMVVTVISPCESRTEIACHVSCGDVVILEFSETSYTSRHQYEYTYELNGETCEDGYTIHEYCSICGESWEWTDSGHRTEGSRWIDLGEYGLCGGEAYIEQCAICGEVVNANINDYGCVWYPQGETEDGYRIWFCRRCGAVKHTKTEITEKDENCCYTRSESYIYYNKDGRELFRFDFTREYVSHNEQYTVLEEVVNCEDGFRVRVLCLDCGREYETTFWGHHSFSTEYDLHQYEGCCGGFVYVDSCPCGQFTNVNFEVNCPYTYEESSYEDADGVKHTLITRACEICGLRYTIDQSTVASENCSFTMTTVYSLTIGETVVFADLTSVETIAGEHQYEMTYEFLTEQENCEYGVRIIYTCAACGASYDEVHHGHVTFSTIYEMSELGVCEGFLHVDACLCGYETHIMENFCCEFEHTWVADDETGYDIEVRTCRNCGFVVECKHYEVNDGCYHEKGYVYSFLKDGVAVIEEIREIHDRWTNHNWNTTYELLGESCYNGVKIYEVCENCGESSEGEVYHHMTVQMTYPVGDCGAFVEYFGCPCGQMCHNIRFYDYGCMMTVETVESEDENGVQHTIDTYTCSQCGLVVVRDYAIAEDGCKRTETETYTFTQNGEELIRPLVRTISGENHDYVERYELNGTNCYDGWKLIRQCKNCDTFYEEWYSHHMELHQFSLTEEHGCCDSHYINVYGCPCGMYYRMEYNSDTFTYDETAQAYVCETCGLTVVDRIDTVETDCEKTESYVREVKLGDETLYNYIKSSTETNHNFTNVSVTKSEGVTTITTSCTKCGTVKSVSMEMQEAVLEYNQESGQYVYDFTVTPDVSGNYTIVGMGSGDTYVELYRLVDGKLERLSSNDDGAGNLQFRLDYYLTAGETYVYRVRYLGGQSGTPIPFMFSISESGSNCSHSNGNSVSFGTLADGSTSCEDGVISGMLYTACGCISNIRTNYTHDRNIVASYDLNGFGFCGGSVWIYECACGESKSFEWSEGCSYNYTYDYPVDENGVSHEICIRTCETCGSVVTSDRYTLKEGCFTNHYYTYTFTINGETVLEYTYVYDYYESHSHYYEYELQGESCEDGVLVKTLCTGCDYLSEHTVSYHKVELISRVELKEYGFCTGTYGYYGYVIMHACPCGYNRSIEWWNGCASTTTYEYVTDENGVYHEIRIDTCETCGSVVTRDSYTLKENCQNVRYLAYTFTIDGETVLEHTGVNSRGTINHLYRYDYELQGDSCEDGVLVKETCEYCDYLNEYVIDYHDFTNVDASVDEGVTTITTSCARCNIVKSVESPTPYEAVLEKSPSSAYDFTFVPETDGAYIFNVYDFYIRLEYIRIELYMLVDGELELLTYFQGIGYLAGIEFIWDMEADETYIYRIGKSGLNPFAEGTVLFTISEHYGCTHGDRKTTSFSILVEGANSCEDGIIRGEIYTACGCVASYVSTGYNHNQVLVESYNLIEFGFCNGEVRIYECACGENRTMEVYSVCDASYENYDQITENGVVHDIQTITCNVCGSVITRDTYTLRENCRDNRYVAYTFTIHGKTVLEDTYLDHWSEAHDFSVSVTTGEGVTTCTISCSKCGVVKSTEKEIHTVVLGTRDSTYDFTVTPEVDGTYVITDLSDNAYITLYKMVDGELIELASHSSMMGENVLSYYLSTGETYVYRIRIEWSYTGGIVCFTFLNRDLLESGCAHGNSADFNVLVDGATSCEDGVAYGTLCISCGCIHTFNLSYDHNRQIGTETLYFDGFGDVRISECACGEYKSVSYNYSISWDPVYSYDSYIDENGISHSVETNTRYDSQTFVQKDTYSVKEGCYNVTYCTMTIVIDGETVFEYTYRSSRSAVHNHYYEYVLQGESCEDGVLVKTLCTGCDYLSEHTISYHEKHTTRVNAEDYGFCGGYLEVSVCACGQEGWLNNYMNCPWDETYERFTDEDGVYHEVWTRECSTCGFKWIEDYAKIKETECNGTYVRTHTISVGETQIAAYSFNDGAWVEHDHRYNFALNNGESCDGGYTVTITCSRCEYSREESGYGHSRYQIVTHDLKDYGSCGGYFYGYSCPCGYSQSVEWSLGSGWSTDYEYPTDENGISHDIQTYTCACGCGTVITRDRYTLRENCQNNRYYTYTVSVNGETIEEYTYIYSRSTAHDYRYEYTLQGETCEEGVLVKETCADCDYTNEWTNYSHSEVVLFTLTEAHGCCDIHSITIYGCPCGYIDYSIGYNQDDLVYDEETQSYSCENCALILVTRTDVVENGCEKTETHVKEVLVGEESLFRCEKSYTMIDHDFSNVSATTSEGVTTITTSCTKCGEVKSVSMKMQDAVLELDEESGWYYYDFTVIPEVSGNYTIIGLGDRDSYVHLYQMIDGSLIEMDTDDDSAGGNGQFRLSHYLNAGETYVYRIRFYDRYLEGTIPFMFSVADSNMSECTHGDRNNVTFGALADGSTSCEDGVINGRLYTACGCMNSIRVVYSHNSNIVETVDLTEYGFCSGYVNMYSCACGYAKDMSWSNGCSYTGEWSNFTDENGVYHEIYTMSCETCGAVIIRDYYTVKENCHNNQCYTYTFTINGETVLEYTYVNDRYDAHNYYYEYELQGESCEDGVLVKTRCRDCDYQSEHTVNYHERYTTRVDLTELGFCGGSVNMYSCACGYSKGMDWYNGCSYTTRYEYPVDENGISHELRIYTCQNCGAVVTRDRYTLRENCMDNYYYAWTFTRNGETVLEFVYINNRSIAHDYRYEYVLNGTSCTDGVQVKETCADCDYESIWETFDHSGTMHTPIRLNAEDHNFCGGYLDFYVCACGAEGYVNTNVQCPYSTTTTSITDADGVMHRVWTRECSTCGLKWIEDRATVKETECNGTYFYTYTVFMGDEQIAEYAFTNGTWEEHDMQHEFILNDGVSCEGGYTANFTCSRCDYAYTRTGSSHTRYQIEYHDLTELGACYGYLELQSCACGRYTSLYSNYCWSKSNNNSYLDENGVLHNVEVRECETCGLRYQRDYYTVRDASTCIETTYNSVSVVCNGGGVLLNYETYAESHDYVITGELVEGAVDCNGGIVVTNTCRDCGYHYSNTYYHHYQVELNRIDLLEYDSCGGYAVETGCLCGYYHSVSLESLCDLDHTYINAWVEGTLNGYYNQDNFYWNYNSTSGIYTCAVTEPEQCTFKIRYSKYALQDENACTATWYETWQFGYNEETGECAYELTFVKQSSGKGVYHANLTRSDISETLEDGTTISGYRYDCSDCGSYNYCKYFYDANGELVKQETVYDNKTGIGDKYREHVYEYAYYTYTVDGEERRDSQTVRSYHKYIYQDDSESWEEYLSSYNYEYERPFGEYGYEREQTYSSSDGTVNIYYVGQVFYRGYGFVTYEESRYTNDSRWVRYDYTYSFENGCMRTTTYTTSSGANEVSEESCHPTWSTTTIKAPTCTQDGLRAHQCPVCEQTFDEYKVNPTGHSWYYLTTNRYICRTCGMMNTNGADGSVVIEDLTEDYGNGEYFVAGYWDRTNVTFEYWLVLKLHTPMESGDDEVYLYDVTIEEWTDVRALAVNRAAVIAAAEALGYSADEYDVRITFVPYGADGSFDYSITFTEDEDEIETEITGDTHFVANLGGDENFTIEVKPQTAGTWVFISNVQNKDPHVELHQLDADGNVIQSWDNDDGGNSLNFRLEVALEAGETYRLLVRWHSTGYSGEIPVYVFFSPAEVEEDMNGEDVPAEGGNNSGANLEDGWAPIIRP